MGNQGLISSTVQLITQFPKKVSLEIWKVCSWLVVGRQNRNKLSPRFQFNIPPTYVHSAARYRVKIVCLFFMKNTHFWLGVTRLGNKSGRSVSRNGGRKGKSKSEEKEKDRQIRKYWKTCYTLHAKVGTPRSISKQPNWDISTTQVSGLVLC